MTKKQKQSEEGLTIKKEENFSEWYTQLITKAQLADYTAVSGCIVFRPASWQIWEKIQSEVNTRIKKLGVENVYFPLFIPEKLLKKEEAHVKGFTPEVAWVTGAGNTKFQERLAVRPTSEAIMYESFSKWIRSHRDLPLKLNQWSNVVRWEFNNPIPFFRTREFVFNEGHTVFATQKEALAEEKEIIAMYKDIVENLMAIPVLIGKKTDKEKFAGALYTKSMEMLLPNGRAIQGPDFHHDGQNFAKAYDIQFTSAKGEKEFAWQNTWAISTRMLGVMFALHSDNKGLVIPPRLAEHKVVIVPLKFEKEKIILDTAKKIKKELEKLNPLLDERSEITPGRKFNNWELKGIPLRIEIGPNDLAKKQVILVARDTLKKKEVKITNLKKEIEEELGAMQQRLFGNTKKFLDNSLDKAENLKDALNKVKKKKIVLVPLKNSAKAEELLKEKSGGAKTLNIPEKQPDLKGKKCIITGEPADYWVYIGKSY